MLTGKYIIKKRFFGGFNIFVEEEINLFNNIEKELYDFKFKNLIILRKARLEELHQIGICINNFKEKKEGNKKMTYEYYNKCECGNNISFETCANIKHIKIQCYKCKKTIKLQKRKKDEKKESF